MTKKKKIVFEGKLHEIGLGYPASPPLPRKDLPEGLEAGICRIDTVEWRIEDEEESIKNISSLLEERVRITVENL